MKICRDFQSLFTSMADEFTSWKDVQSAMGQGRNTNAIMKISVAHDRPRLLSSEN